MISKSKVLDALTSEADENGNLKKIIFKKFKEMNLIEEDLECYDFDNVFT